MILNFKTRKKETNASARVVDGKLILSFPDAKTPIVWQMDLTQAKASALEVLEDEANNAFVLKVKTPKGESIDVATFDQRSHAIEGLMAASVALENAHGHIQTGQSGQTTINNAQSSASPQKKSGKSKILGVFLAIIALFIFFTIWSSIIPRSVNTGNNQTLSSSGQTSPQTSSGVPVSADDFLKGQ